MKRRRTSRKGPDIQAKANWILNLILVAMLLILFRCWHLAVVQYEERLEVARRPQIRVVMEPAKRGTIRDRFNIPLAINKIQYNAAILYSQLRQIPSVAWEKGSDGVRYRCFKRREYITKLSNVLSEYLDFDAERIEDLIHAKASLYFQIPFVLKEDITEEQYYRLRMLEKDWPGIYTQRVPRREYPQNQVASGVIGYLGAISRKEYDGIIQELKGLEDYIYSREEGENPPLPEGMDSPQSVYERYQELKGHAYDMNDYVGKAGIEGKFEEMLRGFHGKKSYASDARGNFLKELPGTVEPFSGQRLLLTLSSELQEYAEQLLIQNEKVRNVRISGIGAIKKETLALKDPWIKGGAIVVMDPNNGEVLALASHPRFDPNDFIASGDLEKSRKKKHSILRWFESEDYLADIWDQKRFLDREGDDEIKMSWENYLEFILPPGNAARVAVEHFHTVEEAIRFQRYMDQLLRLSGQENAYWLLNALYPEQTYRDQMPAFSRDFLEERLQEYQEEIAEVKGLIDPFFEKIPHNYDKVLFLDLYRLAVDADRFSAELIQYIGKQTLSFYRDIGADFTRLYEIVYANAKELFHKTGFKTWREMHLKTFLKEKRAEEKARNRYAKPYIDYLDQKEKELFQEFWEEKKWELVVIFLKKHSGPLKDIVQNLPPDIALEYLKTFRTYRQLNRPLFGKYRQLRHEDYVHLERHLAAGFYPVYGFGYARSQAYRQATTQGSIFKLVTAYAALLQQYQKLKENVASLRDLNPLEIEDLPYRQGKKTFLGYTSDGQPIPQHYKGGVLTRSLSKTIGKIDLYGALATSSNVYFSLLAGDVLDRPEDLTDAARQLSYGSRTGIDLPAEIAGKIPNDIDFNRTGLYATAIGQHSLVVTPLQTATMLSAIANGGKVLKPKIVNLTAGRQLQSFVAQSGLDMVKAAVAQRPTEVKREVAMPKEVRQVLMKGMQGVVERVQTRSTASLSRIYQKYPEAVGDYLELRGQFVGKTSTAEAMEHVNLDLAYGTNKYNHVWFGGISFEGGVDGEEFGRPELVVVVYLRFGEYGKDAIPITAQIIKKWREIKKKRVLIPHGK